MEMLELTIEEIRDIAFMTFAQSRNSDCLTRQYGRLNFSSIGQAISVITTRHQTNIRDLRDISIC